MWNSTLNCVVNLLPLILSAWYFQFYSPSFGQNRLEVIVIENTLVQLITPHAVVAGIYCLSLAKSMSTRDSCSKLPCIFIVRLSWNCLLTVSFKYNRVVNNTLRVNIFDHNWIKVAASLLWSRHQIGRAGLRTRSSSLETTHEPLLKGWTWEFIATVVACCSTSHECLSGDDYEVCKRNYGAMIIVNWEDAGWCYTWINSFVYCILQVKATVRTSRGSSTRVAEIHHVVTSQSQHACSKTPAVDVRFTGVKYPDFPYNLFIFELVKRR